MLIEVEKKPFSFKVWMLQTADFNKRAEDLFSDLDVVDLFAQESGFADLHEETTPEGVFIDRGVYVYISPITVEFLREGINTKVSYLRARSCNFIKEGLFILGWGNVAAMNACITKLEPLYGCSISPVVFNDAALESLYRSMVKIKSVNVENLTKKSNLKQITLVGDVGSSMTEYNQVVDTESYSISEIKGTIPFVDLGVVSLHVKRSGSIKLGFKKGTLLTGYALLDFIKELI